MAELGIIASVIQIADLGVRLSTRLYTFGETVASADKSIISISKDVSLTSSVLRELGQTLEKDQEPRLCSKNAYQTADSIVKECSEVFRSMDKALAKSMSRLESQDGARRTMTGAALDRLKWPFVQPKMELLRSNLERLKSTLLLMINVIIYAKQVADKIEPRVAGDSQRTLIEDLARSNKEISRKHNNLIKDIKRHQGPPVDLTKPVVDYIPETVQRSLGSQERYQETRDTDGVHFLQQQKSSAIDELTHYCNLIKNLLKEVDSAEHMIDKNLRFRIKDDVVNTHRRERRHLRVLHGDGKLKQAMLGDLLDLVELDSAALESRDTDTPAPHPGSLGFNAKQLVNHDHGRRLDSSGGLIKPSDPEYKDYGEWSQGYGQRRPTSVRLKSPSVISFLKTSFKLSLPYVRFLFPGRRKGPLRSNLRLSNTRFQGSVSHPRSDANFFGEHRKRKDDETSFFLESGDEISAAATKTEDIVPTNAETAHFRHHVYHRSGRFRDAEPASVPLMGHDSHESTRYGRFQQRDSPGDVDAELSDAATDALSTQDTSHGSSWLKSPDEVTTPDDGGLLFAVPHIYCYKPSSLSPTSCVKTRPADPRDVVNDLLKQWTTLTPDTILTSS